MTSDSSTLALLAGAGDALHERHLRPPPAGPALHGAQTGPEERLAP
mgnify:CR=1 FL=1